MPKKKKLLYIKKGTKLAKNIVVIKGGYIEGNMKTRAIAFNKKTKKLIVAT